MSLSAAVDLAFWVALFALALLAGLGVARPFLASGRGRPASNAGPATREDGALPAADWAGEPTPDPGAEVRRLLGLLSELEYDYAMQKLDAADYARLKAEYQLAVAAYLPPADAGRAEAAGDGSAEPDPGAKRGPGTAGARSSVGEERPE